jgi:bifunctional UDP-N-acetylglucosamine pyrophosphorylase/glucosamine-1-phosphate N-acetyltransferase
MNLSVVILAAGQGTRMKSSLAKVLHTVCGRPMCQYAVNAGRALTGRAPTLVIGNGGGDVRAALGDQCDYVIQAEQRGTAHAVLQAAGILRERGGHVLVWYADMPLLRVDSLRALAELQSANTGPISMLTVLADDPRGFGRIVRGADGLVAAIIEEAHATAGQRAIRELNVGAYCFEAEFLWSELTQLTPSPKGEYYLTDLIGVAAGRGLRVGAVALDDPEDAIGINTRVHLAETEAIMRRRINKEWMEAGVTMIDPATTLIEPDVTLAADTVIWPNTQLAGKTQIGGGCVIGPNTLIRDSTVGDGCKIVASVIEQATVENNVDIGPYAHLRSGAHLASGVHIGNFGEVKESYLGPGVKMGHFSYIGNARIGANANIGAGTITLNYDGVRKHRTEIGDDAFIGSDTLLRAPVRVGAGATTGAGAVVTKDVPEGMVAVGMPARSIKKSERRPKR